MKPLSATSASPGFDWFMGVLATLLIAGIFQDGWAHNHGMVDQSFFTPWHAVLYGTMALNGLVLLGYGLLNLRRGCRFRDGLPYGYWLCAIGVVLFLFGGLLDMAWHTLFGIEEDINALISPTHLLLSLAAAFVLSGPIRSVARRVCAETPARWGEVGPALLAAASMLSLLAFFTMYANPIGDTDTVNVIGKSDRAPAVGSLYVMNADGSRQTRFMTGSDDEFGASASPDGKYVVYRSARPGTQNAELFVARIDGSGARQITHMGRWASQPAWSPDGNRIAFVSIPVGRSGNYQLLTIHPDGSHPRTILERVAEIDGPAWTADSARIAYGTRNGLTTQIALVPASGGAAAFMAGTRGGSFPAFSRDGKLLAYAISGGTRSGVYVANANGGNARLAVPGASFPAFSARGDRLAFTRTAHGVSDVGIASASGATAANLSHLSGMNASRPAWTPDGRILYSAGANGPVLDTDIAQAFAIDSFLVSSVLIMGGLLLLLRRFSLPLGAITVFVLIYAVEQATQQDHYFAIVPALFTAVLAEIALAAFGNRLRGGAPFYTFAFAFAAMFCAAFIVAVGVRSGGLGWPPNMTFGTPIIAGFAGLLIAFCCAIPLPQPAWAARAPADAPLPRDARDLVHDLRA
ncbi:MAG TPA: hypothetical protein VFN37_12575 [Candidatus Baltobacteraceae bacterium]|nr:hypothetical protein [Candidatus Baltobacteraceae bacterium]